MTRISLTLIAATIAIPLAARQQPSAPPAFRSAVDAVEVDVVVQDKTGRFVDDLTARDFELREDGAAQKIEFFYVANPNVRAQSRPDSASGQDRVAAPQAAGPIRREPRPQRVFIAFFDDDHLTASGFKRVQSAALALFSKEFEEGDVGGVVRNGGIANNRLTSLREDLLKAVRDAAPNSRVRSRQFDERSWPRLSEAEAVRVVVNNDASVLALAIQRACEDDPTLCRNAELAVRSKAAQLAADARSASGQTVQRLLALLNGLTRIEGRKTVVLLSEGFIAEESWPLVKNAVGLAARANARIYTLDARGLDRTGMGDRLTGEHAGASDSLARLLNQLDVSSDSVKSLAVDTGGFVVRNTNVFDAAVAQIGADADRYYLLGFRPEKPPDGQFRRLTVKVNRPDLVVRARRGYLATARAGTSTAVGDASAAPAQADRVKPVDTEPIARAQAEHAPASESGKNSAPAEPARRENVGDAETGDRSGPETIAGATDSAAALALARLRPKSAEHVERLGPTGTRDADADAGWEAYKRGDVESAQRSLALAAARASAAPWMHYALGQSDYALKRYADAVSAWETVRAGNPEFEPVYFDLVDGYLQLKEYDKAIRVMRAARDRWPHDPDVFNALGVVQVARGALDDAVGSFQQAVAAAPQEGTAYFNLAKTLELRYRKSRHYIKQMGRWIGNEHDRATAIDNYERYLEIGGPFEDPAREGLSRLSWVP
jgi:VWFA-related protein